MPRFFIDSFLGEKEILLMGETARHIGKSLRMAVGDALTLCDGQSRDISCVISAMTGDSVKVAIVGEEPSQSESPLNINLYQGLPKSDKMDSIVQKAVELGVSRIIPVLTQRCVSRPDQKSIEAKLVRWNTIARQAAQQSGRGKIPVVAPICSLEEAARNIPKGSGCVLYEAEQTGARDYVEALGESCSFFVGPEGGFEKKEIEFLQGQGIISLSLGRRILRCETAGAAFLAMLTYCKEL